VLRSFIASCQRVNVEPFAWFKDVLARIPFDYVDMKDGEKMTRYYFIEWRGSPTFLWYRDQITCTTPNEEQTLKLIDIASRLSAHVSGDDDERYVLSRTLLGQKKVKAIRP
jgi:hypothetical protein